MSDKDRQSDVVVAYKGFDASLSCRGYKFEVGSSYSHDGTVKACESGFHSCEFPFDVFGYYAPSGNRFALVKASGETSRNGEDSKIASATITIEEEIGIPGLISRAVDWVMAKIDKSIEQTIVTGDQSAATNTGNYSAATNTGDRSAATNTGDRSAAEVSGKWSVASSLGIRGKAKADASGAICLCYRHEESGELIHIRASKVGDNGVKAEVWYELNSSGEFVEVEQ